MDNIGPISSSSSFTLPQGSSSISWRVGQRFDASVSSIDGHGKVSLNIEGSIIEAHTSLAVKVGQNLRLEVVSTDGQIKLSIMSAESEKNVLATALRETLPHQQPLQTVFTRFTDFLSSSSELLPDATNLLKQLMENIPSQRTLSNEAVFKQALIDSGLFLEHKLSLEDQSHPPTTDLKANMLRLLANLSGSHNDAHNTLANHVEAGLARIQLHQLSMLAETQPVWTGEFPIQQDNHVDVFQFQIEKDSRSSKKPEQQSWSMWLSFNIKKLGPINVRITLNNKSMAAVFWAELNSTVNLINSNLNFLHRSLNAVGLVIKDVHCMQGRPPQSFMKRIPGGILDLTA